MAKKRSKARRSSTPRRRRGRVGSRARAIGRSAAVGLKDSALTGGGGVGTYYVHKLISTKMPSLNEKSPYIIPALLFAGGHFVKRKHGPLGNGLLGAAGYALAMTFDIQRMNSQSTTTRAVAPGDTRALLEPSDISALLEPSDISAYDDSLDISEAQRL